MDSLFIWVEHAVIGSALTALTASFVWGVLSVILSPCHLSSIPLIVGFINGQGKTTRSRALLISSLFALSILITIAVIGAITGLMGKMFGDIGSIGNYIVAGVFLLVGLVLMDIIPMPIQGPGSVGMKSRGPLAALILGLIFGVALGPCTFGFMAHLRSPGPDRRCLPDLHNALGI